MAVELRETVNASRAAFEAEVSAAVKAVLLEMEHLASLPPEEANEPTAFNDARRRVIRRLWALAKEGIQYGARSVQRSQPGE